MATSDTNLRLALLEAEVANLKEILSQVTGKPIPPIISPELEIRVPSPDVEIQLPANISLQDPGPSNTLPSNIQIVDDFEPFHHVDP